MTATEDIHSCSYYCTRPGCVLAQRDELRDSHGAGNQVPPTAQPAAQINLEDEILRLRGIVPEILEKINDDLCEENARLGAELARLREQEPEYWQWRRKSDPWELGKIFRSQVYATTAGSEVRCLYAAPPAQPADQWRKAEDAARYRQLRRGQHWSVIDGIGDVLRAEALDAAIDAERAKP